MNSIGLGEASALKLAQEVEAAVRALAQTPDQIPADVRQVVSELSDEILNTPEEAWRAVDPYLVGALDRGALGAARALTLDDPRQRRDELRIRLEQARQALRDILDGEPVSEDQPARDVARWLAGQLDVSQEVIAKLVGTSPRTFQRWVSDKDRSAPHAEDATRVRIVARLANQLRHTLTGPGVVNWFYRLHPELKGEPPVKLLSEPESIDRLMSLAGGLRSGGLT